jgi:hypothetical protein
MLVAYVQHTALQVQKPNYYQYIKEIISDYLRGL